MRVTRRLATTALVFIVLPICGYRTWAAPVRSQADRLREWRSAAAAILGARSDANSLATAAALTHRPGVTTGALELAAHASELAPQNAALGWLHLRLCVETPACEIRDVATVLRWVDAENAASWLPILAAAEKDRDKTEVDRVIADMAQGARFDVYWNPLVVMMDDSLKKVRNSLPRGYAVSDAGRLAAVSDMAEADIIPAYSPLVDACRASLPSTERRDDCIKLSRIMQRADTVSAQLAGFGIERRLLAPDSREAHSVAERRHLLEWRVTAAAQFDSPLLPWLRNTRARERLARMRTLAREEDVCIAILREHKAALEPTEEHP